MKRKAVALVAGCFALFALAAGAADWPGFRGPGSSGVSAETGLPTKWSDKDNIVWRTEMPGAGASSPVIAGDRVFVTCYSGYGVPGEGAGAQKDLKRHLVCLDRKKGTILWQKEVAAKLPEQKYGGYIALHGYASGTPAVDDERVYVFFGKSGVYAFDLKGKQLWQKDVGAKTHNWGSATSPVLYKDLVIVNASVETGGSLVALRKKDGEQEWKAGGFNRTWNTPVLVDVKGGKQELVIRATGSLVGLDPATGKKLWNYDGFGDNYVSPTPVAKDGVVYSLGGRFQGTNVAVKAGGTGDVTETHHVWTTKVGRGSIPSPALYDGHLYWVGDNGTANCVRAKDGTTAYSQRLKGAGTVYASVTVADGKVYVVSRDKGTFVLAAKPKFEQLAHNVIADDTSVFNGSPAVSNGQLFLRSDKYVYCIGKK